MSESCKYGYEVAAASHRGRVRTSNEDAFGYCAAAGFFVVCDGMGGAAAGEIASRVAVDTMLEKICGPSFERVLVPAQTEDSAPGHVLPLLQEAVADANELVFTKAENDVRLQGMGTTLVALLAGEQRAWIAHVGDSRCYRFRRGVLEQWTQDHSLVDEQVRLGQLTREEANRSPLRNVITRAVGSQRSVRAEVDEVEVEPGDLFLLCSDGLTRELTDARIGVVLSETAKLDAACRRLIDEANEAGGRDNVTCLIVRAAETQTAKH